MVQYSRHKNIPPAPCTLHAPPPDSIQLLEKLQPIQDDLLARLLHFAGEEDLIEDGVDFEELEHEVQFAHVAEEGVCSGGSAR